MRWWCEPNHDVSPFSNAQGTLALWDGEPDLLPFPMNADLTMVAVELHGVLFHDRDYKATVTGTANGLAMALFAAAWFPHLHASACRTKTEAGDGSFRS